MVGWNVPVAQPGGDPFDIALVVSFGYFLPARIIDSFAVAVNVHPSLLPRHRGASPIQYAIKWCVACEERKIRIFKVARCGVWLLCLI